MVLVFVTISHEPKSNRDPRACVRRPPLCYPTGLCILSNDALSAHTIVLKTEFYSNCIDFVQDESSRTKSVMLKKKKMAVYWKFAEASEKDLHMPELGFYNSGLRRLTLI